MVHDALAYASYVCLFLNLVTGCLISGGIELAAQMIIEGKSLGCVDWGSVALETAMGCNPLAKGLKAGKAAKGLKCAGNSLVAGTLVHTEQGLVPIEWVKVGDKVLSWDERTGETSVQPVLELIQHEGTYELVKVTLESGEQIEATSGHPFYIQGKGWNAAAGLKVGDALLLYNGTTVVVETVDFRVGRERVYNFSVAQNANYFVGSGGVGVHNICGSDKVKDILKNRRGSVKDAPLPEGSPSGDDILDETWDEIVKGAKAGKSGYKTIKRLLTDCPPSTGDDGEACVGCGKLTNRILRVIRKRSVSDNPYFKGSTYSAIS